MNEEIDYNSRENKLAVFNHALDGNKTQFLSKQGNWETELGIQAVATSIAEGCKVRIKPTPKRVPLEAKDVPPVCWIRCDGDGVEKMILGVDLRTIVYIESSGIRTAFFEKLMERGAEYSTDRVNWLPCSKLEEVK